MKTFFAALCAASASASINVKFMDHIVKMGHQYDTVEEYTMRRNIFEEIDAFIELHNQTNASFTLGHNQFSTMTEAEKAKTRGLIYPEFANVGAAPMLPESSNTGVDWRTKGAVNAIQD